MFGRIVRLAGFVCAIALAREAPSQTGVTSDPGPGAAAEARRPAALEILRAEARDEQLEVVARALAADGSALANPDGTATLEVDGAPAGATALPPRDGGTFVFRVHAPSDGRERRIAVRLGDLVAERRVLYPRPPAQSWYWAAGSAAALGLGGLVVGLLVNRRSVGVFAVASGAEAGRRVALRRGRTRIGSIEQNDLVLTSPLVSRFHAEVVVRGRETELRDLESQYGTEVNGRKVELARLTPGDRIRVGDVDLFFEG